MELHFAEKSLLSGFCQLIMITDCLALALESLGLKEVNKYPFETILQIKVKAYCANVASLSN